MASDRDIVGILMLWSSKSWLRKADRFYEFVFVDTSPGIWKPSIWSIKHYTWPSLCFRRPKKAYIRKEVSRNQAAGARESSAKRMANVWTKTERCLSECVRVLHLRKGNHQIWMPPEKFGGSPWKHLLATEDISWRYYKSLDTFIFKHNLIVEWDTQTR